MIGRVTAVEFTVPLAEMMSWLRESGFDDDTDLSELTHLVDEDWDGDVVIDWDNQRHQVTVRESGSRTARFDLEGIENRYRLWYLQNLDTDEVDMPGLCSFEKHQTFMGSEFRFTYTADPSRLVDRSYLERMSGAHDERTEQLARTRETMAASSEDYNNRITALQEEVATLQTERADIMENANKYAEACATVQGILDDDGETHPSDLVERSLAILNEMAATIR